MALLDDIGGAAEGLTLAHGPDPIARLAGGLPVVEQRQWVVHTQDEPA